MLGPIVRLGQERGTDIEKTGVESSSFSLLPRREAKLKVELSTPGYFSKPDSQCMMFSANGLLSMPGRFMPKAILLGPANWAESIAASPRTTTRPLPKLIAIPWDRPAADAGLELTPGIAS